jgi:hypothetical protein
MSDPSRPVLRPFLNGLSLNPSVWIVDLDVAVVLIVTAFVTA